MAQAVMEEMLRGVAGALEDDQWNYWCWRGAKAMIDEVVRLIDAAEGSQLVDPVIARVMRAIQQDTRGHLHALRCPS